MNWSYSITVNIIKASHAQTYEFRYSSFLFCTFNLMALEREQSLKQLDQQELTFSLRFTFDKVENIKGCSQVIGAIERNDAVLETKPAPVDRSEKIAYFSQETLEMKTILYKKKGSKTLEPRTIKLKVKRWSDNGLSGLIGRADLNVSDLVDEKNSGSNNFAVKLHHGGDLTMKMEYEFVGEAQKDLNTEWDAETDISYSNGPTGNGVDYKVDIGNHDDFKDLGVEEGKFDLEQNTPVKIATRPKLSTSTKFINRSTSMKDKNGSLAKKNKELNDENNYLRAEKNRLERKILDLETQNENLLNKMKKVQLEGRDPSSADLVQDLKNSRMALAIMSQENEEMKEHMAQCGCPM